MASVVYKAFLQIQNNGKLKLFKSYIEKYRDGEQLRDFVYVKDVTRWMCEIYFQKKLNSGVYNMGYGQARTWLDLAKAVFQNMKRELKIDWIEMPNHIRNQYQYFTEADMTHATKSGLSKPRYNLEDGVKDYVTQYLLNHEQIY
jgi:ADP-L-glycero-D-manno-heptose 6-epimerase